MGGRLRESAMVSATIGVRPMPTGCVRCASTVAPASSDNIVARQTRRARVTARRQCVTGAAWRARLTSSPTLSLTSAVDRHDGVDLNEPTARECGHLHGRARGARLSEPATVNLVHNRKRSHVVYVHRRARDVGPRGASRSDHRREIAHDDLGLLAHIATGHLPGDWIESNLPGCKQHSVDYHTL